MRQVPLPLSPEPLATFDAFVPGANAQALAHLRSQLPPRAPLYLWGPSGCGKTHLLRALAHACRQAGLEPLVLTPASPQPWELPPNAGLLILDEADGLDATQQAQAFAALVQAQSLGVAWAAAGRLPVVDLPLREDLRTRIGWGHVFALQPLDEAGTREVLRREALRRGIRWREEVVEYLLRRFERDLGSLMRLLDALDAYTLSRSRELTLALVREMMSQPEAWMGQGAR